MSKYQNIKDAYENRNQAPLRQEKQTPLRSAQVETVYEVRYDTEPSPSGFYLLGKPTPMWAFIVTAVSLFIIVLAQSGIFIALGATIPSAVAASLLGYAFIMFFLILLWRFFWYLLAILFLLSAIYIVAATLFGSILITNFA